METRRICRIIAMVDIYVSLLSLVSVSLVLTFMGIATYSGNESSILDSKFGLAMGKGEGEPDDLTKAMRPILGLRGNSSNPGGNKTQTKDQWLHDNVMILATWMLTTLTLVGTLLSLYAAFRLLRGVKRNVPPVRAMKACRLWWNINISLLIILILDLPLGRVTGLIFSYIGLRALGVWLVNTYIKELNAGIQEQGTGLMLAENGIDRHEIGPPSAPSAFGGMMGNTMEKMKGNVGEPGFDRLKESVNENGLQNIKMDHDFGRFPENMNAENTFGRLKDTVQEKTYQKLEEKLDEDEKGMRY